MTKYVRLLLSSSKGCFILAILDLVICLFAIYFDIQNAGGTISNFQSYLTKQDIQIFWFGIISCITFLLLGYNAKKNLNI